MNKFYFGDSDESDAGFNDDDSNLPFPKPLTRASFLTRDFDPATYLSSLSNRHQTLGDLQNELRELSQSLNKELLDLVNENYQDFLSLGTALKGGEEKVEQVRAGLLAFERDVKTIRDQFDARTREIKTLLSEKKKLRSDIAIGYDLLDIADRIDALEHRLMIQGNKHVNANGVHDEVKEKEGQNGENEEDETSDESFESETDESDDETTGNGAALISLRKLERHINDFLCLGTIVDRVGAQHPFIINHNDRIAGIKSALLLDINTALQQAGNAGKKKQERTVAALRLFDLIGEHAEAISALKKLKV